MSPRRTLRDIEEAGNKIIVATCDFCVKNEIEVEFSFEVSKFTLPRDFLRNTRCLNCGHRGLTPVREVYNDED